MSQLASMAAAVDFIETHLQEPICLADVAEAVAHSLYHFCRVFNAVVHHTPYDYLIRRRLTEAALDLQGTDRRIIDIALDYQFKNPETFSRAFKRLVGVQPYQWRKGVAFDRRLLLRRLTPAHLQHLNRDDSLKPALFEKEGFQVAGLMSLVRGDRQEIAALWAALAEELARLAPLSRPATYYGLASYPAGWEERGFFYLAGAALEAAHLPASSLVVKTLLPARYARFIHIGSTRDLPLTLDYIYQTWLPRSGHSLAGPFEFEVYAGPDIPGVDSEAGEREIWVPVK